MRAIPERTDVPIVVRIFDALSTLSLPKQTAKALVVWQQNSTEIPTVITRLTKEIAFRVMSHQYIRPPMLTTIRRMIMRLIKDEVISKPMKTYVTQKIAPIEIRRDVIVSLHIVRYCS